MKNIIAVIPARIGSKRVPKKNIKFLGNKPLIVYTIEVAKRCKLFDKILVSTDSSEIQALCEKLSVEVIIRPSELSTDSAKTEEALLHVVSQLESNSYFPKTIVTLEPTSPFRKTSTVVDAVDNFFSNHYDSLISVVKETGFLWKENADKLQELYNGQSRRSQERNGIYKEVGVVYITDTNFLKKTKKIVGGDFTFIEVNAEEALDINTKLDFAIAETIVKTGDRLT